MSKQFYFVDLAANTVKPFDGMKAGKFTDMYGRGVEFAPAEMSTFLDGTRAAIEATKAESGDIVGLPIDLRNHEHGDAAGWIVGADLAGDVIRLSAKWTKAGQDLISAGLQRFFSPSVDLQNKAIIGGSLTNWPATRSGGKTLLRPIELSQGVYSFEMTDGEKTAVMDAFYAAFPPAEDGTGWSSVDVIDEAVIVVGPESPDLMKCGFVMTDGEYTFEPVENWVKVEMKVEYEEVESESAPVEETPAEAAPMSEPAVIPARADLSEAQIAALVDERVNERLVELARKADRQRDTLAFSERVCNGTTAAPIGLAVPPAELCEILLSMPDEHEKKIRALLDHVVKVGVVNFSERGHGKITHTAPEPPEHIKAGLKTWLKAGKPLAEFFVKVSGVGKMSDYNLSEYQEIKNG